MGTAFYNCPRSQYEKSENAQQGNGAGKEGRCGYHHVKEAKPEGCWVPGTEETQPQVSNPSSRGDEGTGKTKNKTKIGSLATLERLEVSPSAQVVIRRGTGQVIPSFVGAAAIQRLPTMLGLVRGHLVRGTSAGRGLQLCSRKTRIQR